MRQRHFTGVLAAVVLAGAPVGAQQQPQSQPQQQQGPQQSQRSSASASPSSARPDENRTAHRGIDPEADAAMHRMSDYLSSLPAVRVDSTTVDEVVARSGEKIQAISSSRVSLRRPAMIRSERIGPVADVVFRYDGRQVSLAGNRTGYYATAPAPGTIDETVDMLRDRLGIDIPGADFLGSNPYSAMMHDVTEGRDLGVEPIDGSQARHLAFRSRDVDWQIWIQEGNEPLPRRFVITSKTVRGAPEFSANLSNWDTHPQLQESDFAFTPPRNGRRIQILPANASAGAHQQPRR